MITTDPPGLVSTPEPEVAKWCRTGAQPSGCRGLRCGRRRARRSSHSTPDSRPTAGAPVRRMADAAYWPADRLSRL